MRILRGLRSKLLPCGCTAGIYETYDGAIVTLLDERESRCPDAAHQPGSELHDVAVANDSPPAARDRL
jgi:hypothetical protein